MGKVAKRVKKFKQKEKKQIRRGKSNVKGRKVKHEKGKKYESNEKKDQESETAQMQMKDEDHEELIDDESKGDCGMNLEDLNIDCFLKAVGESPMKNEEEEEEENVDEYVNEEEQDDLLKLHQEELKQLEEKDPEFYKHLQENNKALLEFGRNESDPEDENDTTTEPPVAKEGQRIFTMLHFETLKNSLVKTKSVASFRRVLVAFRNTSRTGSTSKRTSRDESDMETKENLKFITFETDHVYEALVEFCLQKVPNLLCDQIFNIPSLSNAQRKKIQMDPTTSPTWSQYGSLISTYFRHYIRLFNSSSDSVRKFALQSFSSYAILLRAYDSVAIQVHRQFVNLWATEGSSDQVRLNAFLALRHLTCIMSSTNPSFLDHCLKSIYLAYARCIGQIAGAGGDAHRPLVTFLTNCVVDIYAHLADETSAYQHTFVYIRQLALLVRNAYQTTTKKQNQQIVSWKMVCLFRLWTQVLCTKRNSLSSLVYPFVQVALAYVSLLRSSRLAPVKLVVLRYIHQVSTTYEKYVPFLSNVLPMLELSLASSKTSGATIAKKLKPVKIDLSTMLSAASSVVDTKQYRQAVVDACIELLRDHYRTWSYSIAFPEMVELPRRRLQALCKTTKDSQTKKKLQVLLSQLSLNGEWISKKRQGYNPSDMAQVEGFLREEKASQNINEKSPLDRVQKKVDLVEENLSKKLSLPEQTEEEEMTMHEEVRKEQEHEEQGSDDIIEPFELSDEDEENQ